MGDETTEFHFRDLDHVREWLKQFQSSGAKQGDSLVAMSMLSAVANALAVVAGEVHKLRAAAGTKQAEPGGAVDPP